MSKEAKPPKHLAHYVIGRTLGEGTFGKVKAAIHQPTQEHVAIKVLQKHKISEVADVERVSREIHILKLIRHPSIVQLYEIIQTPKQLFLVMEYMEGGELFDYIVAQRRIEEAETRRMFHELIDAVEHIHRIGVVHRDLKPQNILLDYKKGLRVVDFGLSNTYRMNELLKTPCGSPCYAAPEMIKGEAYSGLKVDIWSCGVILFAMLNGYLPFEDKDTPTLYKKILSGAYTFHRNLSEQARDLVAKILENDHSKRYTLREIRSHPWMQQYSTKREGIVVREGGIVIGFDQIPINSVVLGTMREYGFEPEHVRKCLEANRHNSNTTAYYLALKKHLKQDSQEKENRPSLHNISSASRAGRDCVKQGDCVEPRKRRSVNGRDKPRQSSFCEYQPNNISIINVVTQTKRTRINSSFNYGKGKQTTKKQPLTSKSTQKSKREQIQPKRQSQMENRISRKYKQKFNQSLVSRSRDRISTAQLQTRVRVNSSVQTQTRKANEMSVLQECKKRRAKCETAKVIKARRL